MICLSFDIEERFHSHLTDGTARREWKAGDRIAQIVDLLIEHQRAATFFVVGELAEHYPELIRRIADAGFEIGSHTHTHIRLDSAERAACIEDITRSKRVLEDITGKPVFGFRAPTWKAAIGDDWLWDLLISLGFRYDSSLFPFRTHMYGSHDNPVRPFRLRPELLEIPASVWKRGALRVPYGGGFYFRLYPVWLTSAMMASDTRAAKPPLLDFHPWDFDPEEQPVETGMVNRFIGNVNAGASWDKLQRLLVRYPSCTLLTLFEAFAVGNSTGSAGAGDRMISRVIAALRPARYPSLLALCLLLPLSLGALSCSGAPRVNDAQLIKDLDNSRWQIRASAADELGRRRVTAAATRLGTALTDSSEEVRGSAALALGLIGAKSELDKVRKLIDEEDDRQVKVLALYTLAELAAGETGDRLVEDIARVEDKLGDGSRRVKRAAARVLEALRGPTKPEPEAKRLPRAKRSPDTPPQKKWSFDRVEDRITLARDGECTLTRNIVVRGLQKGPTRLDLFLPAAFPEADSVLDAQGNAVAFEFRRDGDQRLIWFAIPPLETGSTASYTISAKSRRPIFSAGADQDLFVYSPAPTDAPVAALRVELALPPGEARVIEPSDVGLRTEGQGQIATLERTGLSHRAFGEVVLKLGLPASALQLPRTPPRYYTRASDLTLAAVVAAIALAILAGLIFWLRRKLGERSHRAILVAVLATGAFLFLTPILIEDNLTYYAMARSAVIDGDLDRVNEFSEMNQSGAFDPDHRGPLDPIFVWMFRTPLLTAADVLTRGVNAITPSHATNGFSFPYLFLTALGDFLAVLLGCLACFSLVERRVGRPYALFAVLAIVAGTNLQLFAYGWTSSSFQPSFFLFAVFLDLWDRTRERRSGLVWLGAGALIGLLGITRTLNLGFVLVPFLDWVHTAWSRHKEEGPAALKGHIGHGVLFVAGLLFTFAPQLVLQEVVDDTWLVDAYGVGTGRFSGLTEHLSGLLIQRDANRTDGLLTTMPMLGLAFIGLIALFRSDKRFGAILTATLALQIYAVASYEIYWGYYWYGTPYLMPSSPIFCLGMASLLKVVHERWGRRGLAFLGAVGVAFAIRASWCTLWQLGLNLTGAPTSDGGTVEVLHAMLMPGRKLDVDVLMNSSEFGCLLRETVAALRAHDFGQLLTALSWVGLLLFAVFVVYAAVTWGGRAMSRIAPRTLQRVAIPALALVWIAFVGWAISLGTKTNLDYRMESETRSVAKREIRVTRLEPGETHTWPIEFEYPGKMSVVTFLEDSVSAPQGSRVGTIEVEGKGKSTSLDLRAGIDTADFAIDRPESRSERAHTAPLDRACMTWRVADDSSHLYTARAYRTGFDVPPVDFEYSINVTSTLEHGTLAVAVVNMVEEKLPRDPSRKRWLADRW